MAKKIADSNQPQLYLASPLEVTPVEFHQELWHQKTRMPVLAYSTVCMILRLAVLVELRFMTDRHRAIADAALT